MKKILLISKDKILYKEMSKYFIDIYSIDLLYKRSDIVNRIICNDIDFIILDITDIELNSEQINFIISVKPLISVPTLLITSIHKKDKILSLLDLQIDDFVINPFNFFEIKTRLYLLDIKHNKDINIDKFKIDSINKRVFYENKQIMLTKIEYEILKILASNPNKTFSNSELYKMIWRQPDYGSFHTIHSHIYTLRKKINQITDEEYIKSKWKTGYYFSIK